MSWVSALGGAARGSVAYGAKGCRAHDVVRTQGSEALCQPRFFGRIFFGGDMRLEIGAHGGALAQGDHCVWPTSPRRSASVVGGIRRSMIRFLPVIRLAPIIYT
jgi:hypothetical protein